MALKESGNEAFKLGDYKGAISKYVKIFAWTRGKV